MNLFPTWVAETQVFGPLFAASKACYQEAGIEVGSSRDSDLALMWPVGIPSRN